MTYNLYLEDKDTRTLEAAMDSTGDPDYINLKWTRVKNFDEFTEYITKMHEAGYLPAKVSFDHDLADEHYEKARQEMSDFGRKDPVAFKERTGLHAAKWLVWFCVKNSVNLPECKVHSENFHGRNNIKSFLENAAKSNAIAPTKENIDYWHSLWNN